MDCIELMIHEHENIKRMLAVIRRYSYKILKGKSVDYHDFYLIIDFVRNYADAHHHGKEESMLFNKMMEELGSPAEKLVRHGMMVEHDLGRLHIQELEQAVKRVLTGNDESRLDIIANAISYTHLLYRHIEKEDKVAYTFAKNNLAPSTIEKLNEECSNYEKNTEVRNTRDKYLKVLDELEIKSV